MASLDTTRINDYHCIANVTMHSVADASGSYRKAQASTPMAHLTSKLLFAAACFAAVASSATGAPEKRGAPEKQPAPQKQADKSAVIGQPVALVVRPEAIHLAGPRDMRQLLVTGRYADGSERDLTRFCEYHAENPTLVNIAGGAFLQPQAAGETALIIEAGGQTARVPVV